MTEQEIILHALDHSRATRIAWLLEILQVDHKVQTYKRNSDFRAPPALQCLHPLGKSPVVEIVSPKSPSVFMVESGYIIEYLIKTYDHNHILTPVTEQGRNLVSYYLHYTEGTLQASLTGALVLSKAKDKSPCLVRFLVGGITKKINNKYYRAEVIKNLNHLEAVAKSNHGRYFVDNKLTAADIILSYPLVESVFLAGNDRGVFNSDPKVTYPYLYKWAQLIINDKMFQMCRDLVNNG